MGLFRGKEKKSDLKKMELFAEHTLFSTDTGTIAHKAKRDAVAYVVMVLLCFASGGVLLIAQKYATVDSGLLPLSALACFVIGGLFLVALIVFCRIPNDIVTFAGDELSVYDAKHRTFNKIKLGDITKVMCRMAASDKNLEDVKRLSKTSSGNLILKLNDKTTLTVKHVAMVASVVTLMQGMMGEF